MNEIIINEVYKYKNHNYLLDVLNYALKELNIKGATFSVTFVGKRYIKKINHKYRHINKVTDVISFAFLDSCDKVNTNMLGDIFICIPKMKYQAKKYHHSEKRELSFLALHGLLHLLGYDHIKKSDEVKMFALQDEILKELNILK
ncbi:MAG TPA: rRNA maturation RNase YbeY [Bacilli bacterium]|nr:rRNA maturation RNase YbeY [Bacilli bacterium]